MMSIYERIYKYLEYKQITAYEFEKRCGLSNGYLYTRKKSVRGIGTEIIEKICKVYKDLNIIWLIIGIGDMVISPEQMTIYKAKANDKEKQEPSKTPAQLTRPTSAQLSKDVLNQQESELGQTVNPLKNLIDALQGQIEALKAGNADKDRIIELMSKQLNSQ
jgi:transcriptional regulator with XRE-family HTH domain